MTNDEVERILECDPDDDADDAQPAPRILGWLNDPYRFAPPGSPYGDD
jgi:hypothetical protein